MFNIEQPDKSSSNEQNSSSNALHKEALSLLNSADTAPAKANQMLGDLLIDFGTTGDLYGKNQKAGVNSNDNNSNTNGKNENNNNSIGTGLGNVETQDKNTAGGKPNPTGHVFSATGIETEGMSTDPSTSKTIDVPGSQGVEQGGYGDCWFESSLAAVASTPKGQKDISNMISANPDGSYTVTFPGDSKHPVTVTQKDLNDPKLADSAEWAKVLEAAFVKYDPKGAKNGGDPAKALKLLTGKTADEEDVQSKNFAEKALTKSVDDIQSALSKGYAVTATSDAKSNDYNGPVVGDHAYQVVAADSASQTITLRNPWGANEKGDSSLPGVGKTKDGITDIGAGEITMSYATFKKHFNDVDADTPQ